MNIGLAISIISAVVALSGALITAMLGARTEKQQLELRAEIDRQGEARRRLEQRQDLMSRIRDPLLQAAFDLQMRIFNIVDQNFLTAFLHASDEERVYAERSTVFLFAQYLGWVEIVRRSVQFLELGENKDNRGLVNCFSKAAAILSTDSLTSPDPDLFHDSLFRIFRTDQRAIGEIMMDTRSNGGTVCIGYAEFCARLNTDETFTKWLQRLLASVEELSDHDPAHPRLVALQHNLIDLINILDPDGSRFPGQHRYKLKYNPLTRIEAEILTAVAEPRSLNEIAGQLGITDASVKFRMWTIMQKLGAQSEAEAVARARREGWLNP